MTDAQLEALVSRERPRLVSMLTLYCGDGETAEDLLQEAIIRLLTSRGRGTAVRDPAGWLYRVAVNLANSWLRRRQIERRHRDLSMSVAHSRHDPDLADAVTVRRAVAGLPRRQREALIYRYFLDLTVSATAERMWCAEGTVRALCSQAIDSLARQLDARNQSRGVGMP